MCEEICARSVPGDEPSGDIIGGVKSSAGQAKNFLEQGDALKDAEADLAEYDREVRKFIYDVLGVEGFIIDNIGKAIVDQIKYTLHGDEGNDGLMEMKELPRGTEQTFQGLTLDQFYEYVQDSTFFVTKSDADATVIGHGPRFATLIRNVFDGGDIASTTQIGDIFDKGDFSTFKPALESIGYGDVTTLEQALSALYLLNGEEFRNDQEVDYSKALSLDDNGVRILFEAFGIASDIQEVLSQDIPAAAIVEVDSLLSYFESYGAADKVRGRLEDAV